MNDATLVLLVLGAGTYGLKAAGPLVLGGQRDLPPVIERLAVLLPIPLLAALVATSVAVADRQWVLDARLAGLAAAALALWWRANFVVVVLVAAATTAVLRAVG